MSEKRFKIGESDIQGEMIFIDTQTNKIYWQEYFDEIVDLVNEQQATISALKEENEQLKKENRVLKKDLNKLYNLLMDKKMNHNELQDVLWFDDE